MALGAGTRVDRYELELMLGEGGQASVWRARDLLAPAEPRALKLIETRHASPRDLERARREARALAKLQHPSICRCYGLFEDLTNDVLGFAMDFVGGQSLAEADSDARLTVALREQALIHVAGALAHLHDHGLVHRDVKPSNIIVAAEFWQRPEDARNVKVVDLGIASFGEGRAITQPGHVVGTPPFMAPEQIEPERWGDKHAPTSDVFSFGILGWLLLAGRHPANLGATATVGDFAVAYRRALGSGSWPPALPVSSRLAPLLARCLELHPRDRWPHAGALLERVPSASTPRATTVVRGQGGSTRRSSPTPRMPPTQDMLPSTVDQPPSLPAPERHARPVRRGRWMAPLTAALALVLVAGVTRDLLLRTESHEDTDSEPFEQGPRRRDPSARTTLEPAPSLPAPTPTSAPQPSSAMDDCKNYTNTALPTGSYRARLSRGDHFKSSGDEADHAYQVLTHDRQRLADRPDDTASKGIDDDGEIAALMCTIFRGFGGAIRTMDGSALGRRIRRGEPLVEVRYAGRRDAAVTILAGDCRDLAANAAWLTAHGRHSVATTIAPFIATRNDASCAKGMALVDAAYATF